MARRMEWEKANAADKGKGGIFGKLPALSSPGDPRFRFRPSFTRSRGVATSPFDRFTIQSEQAREAKARKKAAKRMRKAARRRAAG